MASITSHRSAFKASLAKRLLFPVLPSNDLPPLFATPSTPPELTAEVYDFVALALRAFVNPWWTKISRYDKDFLPDITRILTHVVRELEARVLERDLAPLVFRDVPAILTQHYRDYRTAAAKLNTSYASGGALTLPVLFHSLQPHMALTAEGTIDPEYVRQVVDFILKACLPAEDYAPETERFVIREIVLKILLKDVIPKITQPWFIQKTILDLLVGQDEVILTKSRPASPPAASAFSFHTLIVVFLSAIQALSGACLAMITAYKQAVNTIKRVNQTPARPHHPLRRVSSPFPVPVPQPRSPTSVPIPTSPIPLSPTLSISAASSISSWPASASDTPPPPTLPPLPAVVTAERDVDADGGPNDFALPALVLVSEIFTTPARMAASSITHTLNLLIVSFAPFLDRLLPYLLSQTLSPKLLLTTTRNAKRTLFPNGYPAPPPPDPTPEEQAQTRARLLAYRGKSPWDPLTCREANVHLILLLLDCVLGTLFPELLGA
ncbi:PXA domain-containing protein [Mycena crocata]|nr:PXA domain-containing protein [Mycena crocata]